MTNSNPLTPEEQVIKLINYFFQKERNGDLNAREKAEKKLFEFLIKTKDGSYTLRSNKVNGSFENMHTIQGAVSESIEKFVKPSQLENKKNIKVLDICSGLGYNSSALIEYLDTPATPNSKLELHMIEISPETLAASLLIPRPIRSYKIIQNAIEKELININFAKLNLIENSIPTNIKFKIFIDDARRIVSKLDDNKYDAIFLDPFSPSKSPELYTIEFLKELKRIIKNDGVLATYTSAAPVRSAMVEVGFHIGEGPVFGRKSGGSIASPSEEKIFKGLSSNDERMIALSDAGIPFRDPDLILSGEEILFNRSLQRKEARGKYKFSSVVKAPLFLGKDIELDRNGRRVLRNANSLGINDLKSNEARFIICPQFNSCICSCNQPMPSNSRDRILNMDKRLRKLCPLNV